MKIISTRWGYITVWIEKRDCFGWRRYSLLVAELKVSRNPTSVSVRWKYTRFELHLALLGAHIQISWLPFKRYTLGEGYL